MVCGRPGPSRRRSSPSPDDHDNSCVGSCLSPKGPIAQGRCPREVLRRAITPTDVTGTVRAQRADITVHHVPTEAATSSAAWRSRAAIDLAMSRGRRQSRGPDSRLVTNALRRGRAEGVRLGADCGDPPIPQKSRASKPESSHLGPRSAPTPVRDGPMADRSIVSRQNTPPQDYGEGCSVPGDRGGLYPWSRSHRQGLRGVSAQRHAAGPAQPGHPWRDGSYPAGCR